MEDAVHASLENAIATTADKYHKGLWKSVPQSVKEKLLRVAKEQAPEINSRIMAEVFASERALIVWLTSMMAVFTDPRSYGRNL